jgi:hypothetical protein
VPSVHNRYDVASEKLARFDGLMDGDHSRLYGYGFSYVYRKSPMLALRFSGTLRRLTCVVESHNMLLFGHCGTHADTRPTRRSSSPPPPALTSPLVCVCEAYAARG